MYHIELTLSRAGGKAVVYDVSQMPSNIGMDMQTVLYHIKNDGIIPINSRDEGADTARFNQFQQVDFTLSNSVQQLMNLKLMLEQTAGQICGISPQREGAVSQYEAVGNVQRTVVQSNLVTENWFFQHSEVKKRTIQMACNLMKVCWADGKKAGYILGDGGFKTLTILPDIALNDYGIFITEGGKEDAIKQAITQLSQAALQSGNIDLLNVIKVLKAETLTEAEHILENGISEMKKQAQASQQAQMQAQQAAAQEAMAQREHDVQMKQMEIDGKIAAAEKINEGKVKVANIQADVEADINSDKIEYQTKKDMYATDTNKELEQAKMDMQTKQSDRDRQAANKVKK
jgi:hypothetical protein